MNKTDKRSRKTVCAIQSATLLLLCTHRIDEIKIIDLCTSADINRTTFYLHYRCIPDILRALRSEIIDRIFAESEALIDFSEPTDPLPFLNVCTEVLSSYPNFESFVQRSSTAEFFLTALKNEFSKKLADRYRLQYGNDMANFSHVLRFLTAGVLDTYAEWLKSERSIPFSEVIEPCTPMIAAGLRCLARAIGE